MGFFVFSGGRFIISLNPIPSSPSSTLLVLFAPPSLNLNGMGPVVIEHSTLSLEPELFSSLFVCFVFLPLANPKLNSFPQLPVAVAALADKKKSINK